MSWGSSAARFLASASTVLVVRWLRRHSQQRALLRVWSAKRRPVTTVDATIRLPKEDLDPDLAGCDSVAQLRERRHLPWGGERVSRSSFGTFTSTTARCHRHQATGTTETQP